MKQAAEVVQAKITGPGGSTQYEAVLTKFLPHLIVQHSKRKRGTKGAKSQSGKAARNQDRKVRVVLAKAEGSQQKRKEKSKGKKKKST